MTDFARIFPTALQERKVGMDVEPLGLETGEPADDGLELVTDLIEMVQALRPKS
jgi:hypothetical protein